MHDISKLHPIHQQMYKDFVSNKYTPHDVPDELYSVYLALANIPKEDWGKTSTVNKIKEAQQEQDISVVE